MSAILAKFAALVMIFRLALAIIMEIGVKIRAHAPIHILMVMTYPALPITLTICLMISTMQPTMLKQPVLSSE